MFDLFKENSRVLAEGNFYFRGHTKLKLSSLEEICTGELSPTLAIIFTLHNMAFVMVCFHFPTPIHMLIPITIRIQMANIITCRTVSTEPIPIPIQITNLMQMGTAPNLTQISVLVMWFLPPANVVCEGYFLQVSVCPRWGGGCLPQCMLGCHIPQKQTPPGGRHPPGADTPPEETHTPRADTPPGADPPKADDPQKQTPPPRSRHPQKQTPREQTPPRSRHPLHSRHPPPQSMLGDAVNAQAVRILLECNLVKVIVIRMHQYDHRNQSQCSLTAYYQNRNRNMNQHRSWAMETHHAQQ